MPVKILIVEDEEKIARFVELELQHEGYAVEKAGDGRKGLSLAESGGFDLVLLDVMLPELSGLEVLRTRFPGWTWGRTIILPNLLPLKSFWPVFAWR